MTQFLSFILILFVGITSFAQTAMPQQQFQELTKKVVALGKESDRAAGTYLTVSDIFNLPQANAHQADYISTVGGFDSSRNYHFARVEIISEKWHRTQADRWDIDQWLFTASAKGEISFGRHVHMVQTANGTVVIHETIPSELTEEELQWNQQVNQWYLRLMAPKPVL